MSKFLWILLAAFVALAVIGVVIDTLRFLVGVGVVAVLVVLAVQLLTRRRRPTA